LLHDVPEDTYKNPKDGILEIQKEFGPEVAFLVSGITKLSVIKYRGEKRYVENLRKLFVAMSKDLRVIFIKLADRIHNLQTLKYLRPDKAERIALESLEIYAPIAERLGISSMRTQIEEYAFKYVYPEEMKKYLYLPNLDSERLNKQVEKLIKKTQAILDKHHLEEVKVFGRKKTFYSIFRKMTLENKSLEQIYDLIALRIVTNSISNCYKIMSILHEEFEVTESRTKDYIQNPKLNGYQSLHMTVKDTKTGLIFEYQIRTRKMHDFAEFGVASHWWYKEYIEGGKKVDLLDQESFRWISQLVNLSKKNLGEQEYLKHVKLNVFPNRIFVFTPKGDVIDLPEGASALDFAFKIHESIGSHAQMAKLNGKICKLNDILKNGDTVEIITSKNQQPKREWLDWTKTDSASKKIRAFLRGLIQLGK
jgi:GTP pyrophosphokinase